jgi:hypothetical protein
MSKILYYTIESENEADNSNIQTWLPNPTTQLTKLTVTALTTKCSIVVLDTEDYIIIDDVKYQIEEEYCSLSAESAVYVLNELLEGVCEIKLTYSDRLQFIKAGRFVINDASYRMKQITGLYNTTFPIVVDNVFRVPSTGFYLSTPILYLLCNLGSPCFIAKGANCKNQPIVMRINNAFTATQPIVANNAEFSSIIQSNSLSNIRFKLVDANFQDIRLLSPIYLSATGEAFEFESGEAVQDTNNFSRIDLGIHKNRISFIFHS